MKLIIIITLVVILGFTSFFVYRNIKENSYQKKYPELYVIKDYLVNIEDEEDLCDALRYDSDGKEVDFYTRYGFEDGYENDLHKVIRPELKSDKYTVRYHIEYIYFDERYSEYRLSDKLRKKLLLQDTELYVEFFTYQNEQEYIRYVMEYNYKTFEYRTYMSDESGKEIATEFDEDGQEIYDLILEDITKRINQCEK